MALSTRGLAEILQRLSRPQLSRGRDEVVQEKTTSGEGGGGGFNKKPWKTSRPRSRYGGAKLWIGCSSRNGSRLAAFGRRCSLRILVPHMISTRWARSFGTHSLRFFAAKPKLEKVVEALRLWFADNMPLALAITKGRTSSSHLIQSCRVQLALWRCRTRSLDCFKVEPCRRTISEEMT